MTLKSQLSALSDAALVQAYRNGQSPAWEVLFNRYHTTMTSYIASISGNDYAQDIMQDVWAIVITAILNGSYKEEQQFKKYIKGIAYKEAINSWYAEHRFQHLLPEAEEQADHALNAEQQLANEQTQGLLEKAVGGLDARDRQLVILRAWQQRSFHEIAVIMHIEVNVARSLYSRAVKRLRHLAAL